VKHACAPSDAFAFHVEDNKCTEFTKPSITATKASSARPGVAPGLQVPKDGGLSLTYNIKDSVCKGTGEEKAMRVTLLCDKSAESLKFID